MFNGVYGKFNNAQFDISLLGNDLCKNHSFVGVKAFSHDPFLLIILIIIN